MQSGKAKKLLLKRLCSWQTKSIYKPDGTRRVMQNQFGSKTMGGGKLLLGLKYRCGRNTQCLRKWRLFKSCPKRVNPSWCDCLAFKIIATRIQKSIQSLFLSLTSLQLIKENWFVAAENPYFRSGLRLQTNFWIWPPSKKKSNRQPP